MENKRVVLINGDSSSWFEQAIIVVKDGQMRDCFESGRPTPSLVAQAESIVNGCNPFKVYNNFAPMSIASAKQPVSEAVDAKLPKKSASTKRNSFDTFLNFVMIVSCVVLAGVLFTQL